MLTIASDTYNMHVWKHLEQIRSAQAMRKLGRKLSASEPPPKVRHNMPSGYASVYWAYIGVCSTRATLKAGESRVPLISAAWLLVSWSGLILMQPVATPNKHSIAHVPMKNNTAQQQERVQKALNSGYNSSACACAYYAGGCWHAAHRARAHQGCQRRLAAARTRAGGAVGA